MSAGLPPEADDAGRDLDAEFAAMMQDVSLNDDVAAEGEHADTELQVPDDLSQLDEANLPKAVKVAVVLTPLASAETLAGLCAMSDLACTVVPARSGAFAVQEFVSAHSEWDVSELLGGAESEPAEAAELASTLSNLARDGVILLTADLATDVGIETGLSGQITARRYVSGKAGEEASAGLVLSAVEQSVEDVLFGVVKAGELPGALDTQNLPKGRALRMFGRGLRRPRGPKSGGQA